MEETYYPSYTTSFTFIPKMDVKFMDFKQEIV